MKELAQVSLQDGGRVAYCGAFGDDLDIANVAYVSTDKQDDTFDPARHGKFIRWLWNAEHTSPFRHQHVRFRIKCPIFVARQWMKHTVGCAWNERSARYVPFEKDAWRPVTWREGSEKIKQGSLGELPPNIQARATEVYFEGLNAAYKAYDTLLGLGVCREQARIVTPVGMMTELIWTCSLQSLLHFLALRLDAHAQKEIRVYAKAVYELIKNADEPVFNYALSVLIDEEAQK
jgi:thymidylate synthase (FAD)